MKSALITALRLTAHALLTNNAPYSWHQPHSCNCGIVVCALTNKSPGALRDILAPLRQDIHPASPTWENLVQYHCPLTGLSNTSIFAELKKTGIQRDEIIDLEFLRNRQVRARMKRQTYPRACYVRTGKYFWTIRRKNKGDLKPINPTDRIDAAHYMLAWADILTEQGVQDAAPTTTIPIPASVT